MTQDLLDRLSLDKPLLQAAMGGGVARPELVTSVSLTGSLGTLGIQPANTFEQNIHDIKTTLGNRPFAVNLLMPFTTKAHIQCCIKHRVPVVSIFYGFNKGVVEALKQADCYVLHQVGTISDAERAIQDGADGLIIQGVEAGGHLSGTDSLEYLLPQIRERFPKHIIFGAGGVYDKKSAERVYSLGANGVASGTRFLMSVESGAHILYKQKLLAASHTHVSNLFSMGWPAPHRVINNDAVERWHSHENRILKWTKGINFALSKMAKNMPLALQEWMYNQQRLGLPLYSPMLPNTEHHNPPIEASALYAGTCVADIHKLESAADIVKSITA